MIPATKTWLPAMVAWENWGSRASPGTLTCRMVMNRLYNPSQG